MQSEEAKSAFLSLRANGWSLRSIASRLGVSKSTLFNWERDPETRRIINTLKCIQIQNIQEKFIPSFEEELQKLSSVLSRVESALNVHSFFDMRPEFLLRMSVQLRTRLQKLRCDVHPVQTFHDDPEIRISPRPGCISRSDDLALPPKSAHGVPSPQGRGQGEGEGTDQLANVKFPEPAANGHEATCSSPSPQGRGWGEGEGADRIANAESHEPSSNGQLLQSESLNGAKLDRNKNSSQPDSSSATTSNSQNGTLVQGPPPTPTPTPTPIPFPHATTHDRALAAILEALRALQLGPEPAALLSSNGERSG